MFDPMTASLYNYKLVTPLQQMSAHICYRRVIFAKINTLDCMKVCLFYIKITDELVRWLTGAIHFLVSL